jgi:hippurate hydrolase
MHKLTSYTATLQESMQTWRHDIHRHPELAFEEQRTADKVAELLTGFGLEVHRAPIWMR